MMIPVSIYRGSGSGPKSRLIGDESWTDVNSRVSGYYNNNHLYFYI